MKLVVVANTPAESCLQLKQAVIDGIHCFPNIELISKSPFDTSAEDVLDCSGIIIGTTENFGYMSGQIKDFFERIYNPCLEQKQGLAVALYIKAGNDGTGAMNSVEKILLGLKWKLIQPTLIIKGSITDQHLNDCHQIAQTLCAGLEMDIF